MLIDFCHVQCRNGEMLSFADCAKSYNLTGLYISGCYGLLSGAVYNVSLCVSGCVRASACVHVSLYVRVCDRVPQTVHVCLVYVHVRKYSEMGWKDLVAWKL